MVGELAMDKEIYLHEQKEGRVALLTYPSNKEVAIHDYLQDIISQTGKKGNLYINFYGLSTEKDLIFNILYHMGYSPIRTTRKKDMKVKDFRYAISRSKCYYIQIKVHEKAFITIQNVECIIGTDDLSLTGKAIFELFHKVKDFYTEGLKRKDRILYTISGMSRNLFSRVNPDYARTLNVYRGTNRKINDKPMNVFLEEYCRPAVRGGFMFLTNEGIGYTGCGISLDVNSIYPYVSRETYIPTTQFIGVYNGEPESIKSYFYYIYKVKVYGMECISIPCICRDTSLTGSDYIGSAKQVKLTLTETDLELLKENYKYDRIEYISYVVFNKSKVPFKRYFDTLYEHKRTSTGAQRQVPKFFMNTFIGNFLRKPYTKTDILKECEDGFLRTVEEPLTKEETIKQKLNVSGLCYIGGAILSAARAKIIHDIKSIPDWEDRWLYSDTDSIYLKGYEVPKEIHISDRMGDYKVEHTFTDCVFYGNKQYILSDKNDGLVCKLAGVPITTRRLMLKPEEWIYTEPHTRYYERQIQKLVKTHHLARIFSQKLPIIFTYVDYVSEDISYRVEWKKIVSYKKKSRKKYEYSDFHRLDEAAMSDDELRTHRAIAMYNEHAKQLNPDCDFYKAVHILQLLKSGVPPTQARWQYPAVKR